jgi:hypothetical protein
MWRGFAVRLTGLCLAWPALAYDMLRIAVGQRGLWDISVPELGQRDAQLTWLAPLRRGLSVAVTAVRGPSRRYSRRGPLGCPPRLTRQVGCA